MVQLGSHVCISNFLPAKVCGTGGNKAGIFEWQAQERRMLDVTAWHFWSYVTVLQTALGHLRTKAS